MSRLKYLLLLALAVALPSSANTITYVLPPGSTTSGGPVSASATFTTGAGTLAITLTNLQANPTDAAQLLSDLDFVLSGGQTIGTLSNSSGLERTVNSGGSYTDTGMVSTGWSLINNFGGGLQLQVLGTPIGPAHLIIGGPNGSNVYSNANGSIAGNGPHNPFLTGPVTFNLAITGVTASSSVTSAIFSFGTGQGADQINVPGVPQTVKIPEPASLALLGIGLLAFGASRRKHKA
jgi:hypothetical protein